MGGYPAFRGATSLAVFGIVRLSKAQTILDHRTKTLKAAYKSRAGTATYLPMTSPALVCPPSPSYL